MRLFQGRTVATYSFANTPLKAAHPPLEMASISHVDLGTDKDIGGFVEGCCTGLTSTLESWGRLTICRYPHPSLVENDRRGGSCTLHWYASMSSRENVPFLLVH
jgi:hypothetical protein